MKPSGCRSFPAQPPGTHRDASGVLGGLFSFFVHIDEVDERLDFFAMRNPCLFFPHLQSFAELRLIFSTVKGDSLSFSIAAASVLAKVTRDRIMVEADVHWPGFGFAKHKGYPTTEHFAALKSLGPCPIHRRSFAPLRGPASQLEFFA